jgi:phosphoglycerol transferase MdoB-like AlkP superfamily enzyme
MGWRVTIIAAGIIFSGWIGIAAGSALPVDDHAFSIIRGRAPRILAAGAEVCVKLELGNEGRRVWRADGSFAVSYHWLDQDGTIVDWEGRRTRFPRQVGPGDTVEIDALLVAPQHPGSYRLQWDVVEEGVCWFSQRASVPPPADAVRVVSDPISDPRWWALFSLLAAAAAVAATAGGSRRWAVLFAVGDVLWCFGALTVKQSIVLTAAGFPATVGGWLMICGGAAACLLAVEALPERFRGWARWGLAAGATCVLWADAVHLRFFGDLPSPAELLSVGQLGRVEASIRSLLEPGDIWFWLDLIAGVALVLTAARLRRLVHPRRRVVIVALGVIVLAGAVAGVRFAVTQPGLYRQVFRRVMVAREVGVLNLQAIELGGSLKHRLLASELSPEALAETTRWFVERAPLRAGVGEFFGVAKGANLVMVQVESLQGFVIGLEIEGREVTPFLNRWRQEALWFSNVTDQTGGGRSADSELATQVSLLPPSGGAAAFRFAGNDFTGLAEVLAEHDYHTVSAVPYDGSFWNRRRTHPAYGFQRSRFVDDFSAGESIGWGLNDRDFLAQMADRLTTAERPFAAYLLTLSLHHPFAGFPEHLKELNIGRWEGTPFGNFLHTMKFFDRALAGFVADLERDGLSGSTVIAIWGDHDAGFDWRSEIAAAMGATFDPAGWYLSQEVPLVIKVPGAPELSGERPVAAGHVDVAPTLLALLGIDPAPYAFVGRNLLGEPGDTPVVGEYGCWRDARHLFLQGDGTLADGQCLDVATLVNAPSSECAEAFAEARRAEEISSLVLEHDLQQRISDDLAETLR